MDVKTFNELYAEVAKIHRYFVNLVDMNANELWSDKDALEKYKNLLICFNELREAVSEEADSYDDDYTPMFLFICKAIYDDDINGANLSHILFEDEKMIEMRIEALAAVDVIAEGIALDEIEKLELRNGIE